MLLSVSAHGFLISPFVRNHQQLDSCITSCKSGQIFPLILNDLNWSPWFNNDDIVLVTSRILSAQRNISACELMHARRCEIHARLGVGGSEKSAASLDTYRERWSLQEPGGVH